VQDYPHELMEVLVADGMSTDGTRAIIAGLARSSDIKVVLIDNPRAIVATGLNLAIARAKGEIVVRVDGHTVIEGDYVRQCVECLKRSGASEVGGRMDAVGKSDFGKAVALATSTPFGVGDARFHYSRQEEIVDSVYMGAWWRDTLRKAGPFDEELVRNQDDEYSYRLRALGGTILLSPAIRSHYYTRTNLGALWHQYFQYGFWKVRVLQKHPRQMKLRHFAPPLFSASLLATAALAPFDAPARKVLALLAGSYLLANLLASVWATRNGGLKYLPHLPVVYAALHLSYGTGFLAGLVRFAPRWKQTK
jgi:GT2 family glycosyltransferase